MTTPQLLGQETLGMARLGDGALTTIYTRRSALPVSATISISKYASALPVSATIQRTWGVPLLIYTLVVSPRRFALNGDGGIIAPDQVTYTPRPVVARTLLAGPLMQGYRQMTWTWSVLQLPEYLHLLGFYNPQNPQVTVTYPDEFGAWQQRALRLLPPTYGTRETVSVTGVSFTFTGLL